ncbi:NotI family restriction endonuclease [Sedimenticola thiotaurini]|uniref:NotI family restriction endonuclease n=1 Tax=Sedimenticola thiotaurini TaxID=1543721 RepID=UPI0009E375EE|nr:NotI family restriction endonuclease [Sedimenticola thiotaurini]
MLISEVFGHGVEDLTDDAQSDRRHKNCRFRGSACTKSSTTDPIGICSLSDGVEAASLCPFRFLESDRIFTDAARLSFGPDASFGVFPEVRILKIPSDQEGGRDRKIGKVDYILGRVESGEITDFAAVEVQAVYFSGREIRTAMNYFLAHGALDIESSDRRPDFRSSAQKRLIPQLQLKVPVFRRWGKKFFVVVDTQFFRSLPSFSSTTQANSELTWLSYPLKKTGSNYTIQEPMIVYSEWDEVQNSLREGSPPEPSEIVHELQTKLTGPQRTRPRILRVNR